MSGSPASEASARIAAESLALRRSPLDPLRATGAAEGAALEPSPVERAILGDLLERLADPSLAEATLAGDPEGAARLATLVVADALLAGASRLLWVGPRPRSVDRLCERCALRLVSVRNERGAYDGEGLFWVADLESAPPGLAQADPFDRVVTAEVPAEPLWRAPTLVLGEAGAAVSAPAVARPAPATSLHPPCPAATAIDEALVSDLRCLEPGLGPLARAAAAGSPSNRIATLKRLETRLGRMVRAARAGRSDDGAETARQLASDRDGSEALLTAALEASAPPLATDIEALEAEREHLASLREALEGSADPVVQTLSERAQAAVAEGVGVALVLPRRGTRDALAASLADRLATAADVDERLDEARRGPAVALLSLAEHRSHRLDPVTLERMRVLAHADAPIPAAHELVGEGEPRERVPEPETTTATDPARERWAHWRAALGLSVATAHPEARAAIAAAHQQSAAPWSIAHLRREEGDALLVVGEERAHERTFASLEEASFVAELELLRVARRRLERSLDAARDTWRRAQAALRERERAVTQRIEEARRRKARASGSEARREAGEALTEAEQALEPLRAEARALDEAHRADRQAALERFAARAALTEAEAEAARSSHPQERLHG